MAFSTGPYRTFTTLPSPESSTLTSSRTVDFITGDYALDDDGGFDAQDDIAQRVALLCAFAVKPQPFNTPQSNNAAEQDIRAALDVMTAGKEPEIRLLSVSSSSPSPGVVKRFIEYVSLVSNTKTTVVIS